MSSPAEHLRDTIANCARNFKDETGLVLTAVHIEWLKRTDGDGTKVLVVGTIKMDVE